MKFLNDLREMFFGREEGERGGQKGEHARLDFKKLADALKNAADRSAERLPNKTLAPNHFTILLSPPDMERFETRPVIRDEYLKGFKADLEQYYKEKSYTAVPNISLEMQVSEHYDEGHFGLTPSFRVPEGSGQVDKKAESKTPLTPEEQQRLFHTVLRTVTHAPEGQKLAIFEVTKISQEDSDFPKGKILSITKEKVRIGRFITGYNNPDIKISEKETDISRIHAELEKNGDDYYLTDKSANGTWLNGKRLSKDIRTPIKENDRILLAEKIELLFRLNDDDVLQTTYHKDNR
jgi:hypothetical protein